MAVSRAAPVTAVLSWPMALLALRALAAAILIVMLATSAHAQTDGEAADGQEMSDGLEAVLAVVNRDPYRSLEALTAIEKRGKADVAHALVEMLRFFPFLQEEIIVTLKKITGDDPGDSLTDWVLWSQQSDDVASFPDYDRFKGELYATIDPDFRLFLRPGVKHSIRLEDVTWGGVALDGIPALFNPTLIPAAKADYLTPEEPVFGIEINGDSRAYPLRIMDWHEMFNDVIGGVPVSLAYCTLCASGILFETEVEGYDQPFTFGSSGFLYYSNKLMYDRQTYTLWNQFTGEPAVGALVGTDIRLPVRPVAITAWGEWLERHPETRVLSLDTGYDREYEPGKPYGPYFESPDLMFPVTIEDTSRPPKSYVFALRLAGAEKAWPLEAFDGMPVIRDTVGGRNIVLFGEPESRTVRAYDAGEVAFDRVEAPADGDGLPRAIAADGTSWTVTEEALISPDGTRLDRLPGHIGYWFAFRQYYPDAPVYGG